MFCFRVNRLPGIPQLNETVRHDNIRESDRHDRRYMYVPSFALAIYKTACHAKPYLCYLYRSVQYRYLSNVCLQLASLINMWWMLMYRTLRKVTSTNMRKKHVRDSKMCCCCGCGFCCGDPTTDERIHAPVLHDASETAYWRN